MPPLSTTVHVGRIPGGAPQAPTVVTSITADASATVSFRAPTDTGDGPVTHWVVTPYIGATPQSTTTTPVASAGSITGSDGNTYVQVPATGLTNDSSHTFTVIARNAYGDSPESAASAANTPRSGLIFGDEFNGPSNGAIDPEHWLLDVSATSDEADYYRPSHVYLDGSSHLVLKSTNDAYGGKPYTSGCIQNNVRNFFPASGNTLTFETSAQVCSGLNDGMWPAPWLCGTYYQQQFKTDQSMSGHDSSTKAEIDYAEWFGTGPNAYNVVTWASDSPQQSGVNPGFNLSLAQHIYRVDYKPNVSCKYYFDGALQTTHSSQKPTAALFHMWFQQIQASTTPSSPQYTYIDWLRIYDRNLG